MCEAKGYPESVWPVPSLAGELRPWLLVRLAPQKAACPPTDPTTASPSSAHNTTATREASRP